MAAADPFAGQTGLAARAAVLEAPETDPAPVLAQLDRLFASGAPSAWEIRHADDGGLAAVRMAATLDSRSGGDLILGLLWLEGLRRAGLRPDALAYPARLLLRLNTPNRTIIDPCRNGQVVEPPELRTLLHASGTAAGLHPDFFAPLSDEALLLRLLAAVKLRSLRLGQIGPALVAVEGSLRIAPDRAKLWREAGLMRMRLGDLPGAVAALEQFVARTDNQPARSRASQLLAQIRVRMP
jgi:regulator of sirC expression with transglutaminase-like and TPR domain